MVNSELRTEFFVPLPLEECVIRLQRGNSIPADTLLAQTSSKLNIQIMQDGHQVAMHIIQTVDWYKSITLKAKGSLKSISPNLTAVHIKVITSTFGKLNLIFLMLWIASLIASALIGDRSFLAAMLIIGAGILFVWFPDRQFQRDLINAIKNLLNVPPDTLASNTVEMKWDTIPKDDNKIDKI
jgi:hypothetical protein